jgi:hypothetical protein
MRIFAESKWIFEGPDNEMFQTEHDELFASIRNARPINNGDYMARGTMLAILGRMAAYTGQEVTWDQAVKSKQDLSPSAYDWNGTPPPSKIAIPGQTPLV